MKAYKTELSSGPLKFTTLVPRSKGTGGEVISACGSDMLDCSPIN